MQLSGSRKVIVTPTKSCREVCSPMHILMNEGDVCMYTRISFSFSMSVICRFLPLYYVAHIIFNEYFLVCEEIMSRCKYLYSQEILMLFFPLNLCPIDFINAIIVFFYVQNCAVKTTCILPRLYNPSIVFKVFLSQFLPISLLINYALALIL